MCSRRSLRVVFASSIILSTLGFANAEVKAPLSTERLNIFAFPVAPTQVIIFGGTTTTVELYDYRTGSQPLRDLPFQVENAVQLTDGTILASSFPTNPRKFAIYKQPTNEWQVFDAPPNSFFALPF